MILVSLLCLVSGATKAFSSNTAEIVPLQLQDVLSSYALGRTLHWIADSSGELQIGDMLDSNLPHWISGATDIPNLGYTSDAV